MRAAAFPSSAFVRCVVIALALAHALLALTATLEKSTTSDELAHVTGGYTFNRHHDYRLQPENGLLPQRWQALPLLFSKPKFPSMESEAWRNSDVWRFGYRFFYQEGNNHERMLLQARAMNSLFGAATVLLVYAWSSRLFGIAGGLLSAAMAALCPGMLAHSGLATSDAASVFFLLAASTAWWRHLHRGDVISGLVSALCFGLACTAKYSSALLLPIMTILLLVRAVAPETLRLGPWVLDSRLRRFAGLAGSAFVHGVVAILVIWTFCGFRYSAFNPALPAGEFVLPWEVVLGFGGIGAQVVTWCREWHILPEAFLYGFAFVMKHAEARAAFLNGEYSIFGWVGFFPYAFLVKTPLTSLTLFAAGALAVIARWRNNDAWDKAVVLRALDRVAPLVVLFIVYWAVSLTSNLNIGHRHILPTYPPLFILAGAVGAWLQRRLRHGALATLALLLPLGFESLLIRPHYLAYFNAFAGGPSAGWRHLVDSSLDWGQDLPALKRWLERERKPGEPVYLSYFGTGEPDHYNIDAIRMPMIHHFDRHRPWYWFEPGIYAISATMLQHVYMPIRGHWTLAHEREYQQHLQNDPNFRLLKAQPNGHPELFRETTPADWARAWTRYEMLRFARLCYYLRARGPDASAGHSILIFRLNAHETEVVSRGSAREFAELLEAALSQSRQEDAENL